MSTDTDDDVPPEFALLKERLEPALAEKFAAEHPDAPEWACQLAATIDDLDQRVTELKHQKHKQRKQMATQLTEDVEELERAVEAIEQQCRSTAR